jgi:hypothetical protein
LRSLEPGGPAGDLDRLTILIDSFCRCFDGADIDEFLIIARPDEAPLFEKFLRNSPLGGIATVLDETIVCPSLSGDPDTLHDFPTPNKGWFRQQLLKLGIARCLNSAFYMTLDADVVFTQGFRPHDLISDGRSTINTQTTADFKRLFTPEVANESAQLRRDRDRRSEELLGVNRTNEYFFGETPVILSVPLARQFLSDLDQRHLEGWESWLIRNRPWTEYSLYFTYAEGSGRV